MIFRMRSNLGKHPKRLWILENDADLNLLLTHIAKNHGFEVKNLTHLAQAWVCLRDEKKPDRVISSAQLPDGASSDWLLQLRERYPEIPILCLYATPIHESIRLTLRAAGILFRAKPVTLAQLYEIIEERR